MINFELANLIFSNWGWGEGSIPVYTCLKQTASRGMTVLSAFTLRNVMLFYPQAHNMNVTECTASFICHELPLHPQDNFYTGIEAAFGENQSTSDYFSVSP